MMWTGVLSDERNETRAVTERRRKQGGRLRPDPGELSERKAAIVTNVRRKGAALLSHRSPPPFVTRSVRSLHVPSPYSFLPEGLSEEGNPRHEAPTRKGGGRYEKRPIRTEGSRPTNPRNQIDSFFHLRILSHKTSYFLLLFSGSLHNNYKNKKFYDYY